MTRTACAWAVIAALAVLAWGTADPSPLTAAAGALTCLAGIGLVVWSAWLARRR